MRGFSNADVCDCIPHFTYRMFLLHTLWMIQCLLPLPVRPVGAKLRRGNAQHKMGSTSLLCHKQIKVHNIMFVYKLGGYRNTVYNNNYIIDTMLSCMSTIFRSWLDEWLATFPNLYSLIYTAWNYIWMSLVEIWNRQKLTFKSMYLEIKLHCNF